MELYNRFVESEVKFETKFVYLKNYTDVKIIENITILKDLEDNEVNQDVRDYVLKNFAAINPILEK